MSVQQFASEAGDMAMSQQVKKVILVGVGCFNPPTIMHLRMFDIGKDYLEALRLRPHKVLGGIISPAHDKYKKSSLIPGTFRSEMVSRAIRSTDGFVRLSTWELEQDEWTPTRNMLDSYRDMISQYVEGNSEMPDWLPPSASKDDLKNVQLLLLCGVDLVESFSVPDLWKRDDIISIVRDYGLIVLSRGEANLQEIINNSDILYEHRENIHFVLSDMGTDISSTKIRLAVRRGKSVRYVISDPVMDYIKENRLYSREESEDQKREK